MEKLGYEILIEASPQKVWQVLWDPNSYSQSAYYFSPSSSMHSDWKIKGKSCFWMPTIMGWCLQLSSWTSLEE